MIQGETHLNGRVTLYRGDSRDVLKQLPDNSIDSVVTDPPYALVSIVKRFGGANAAPAKGNDAYQRASAGFMGKQWDTGETAFAVEFWAEVMRVLKPGGHVIAASATRTYHRLAVAIEDAGFEIRDMVQWLYGSGFPKSHDVSKGIDRAAGAVREVIRERSAAVAFDTEKMGGGGWSAGIVRETEPATPEAAQWQGWGTALKPACEPWVLARKPLAGTVAANVLAHGCGALNIDGCRVGTDGGTATIKGDEPTKTVHAYGDGLGAQGGTIERVDGLGRWPANVIHDGSDEVVAGFPETGAAKSGGVAGWQDSYVGGTYTPIARTGYDDNGGSAARFFYSAKADAMDRAGSKHPTVKPVDLMQYLCRLITPPGGVVLDPFAGSGSTGEAAWREGFRCVLIEREEEYAADIRRRLELADLSPETRAAILATRKADEPLGGLFAALGDE